MKAKNWNNTGHANRGLDFEDLVNTANEQYMYLNIAVIGQVPVPTKINIDKDRNSETYGQVMDAHFVRPALPDFMGRYGKIPISFDAKNTREEKRFPLSNIKDHQIRFLNNWTRGKEGEGFFLVRFEILNRVFRIDIDIVNKYYQQWIRYPKRGNASIPLVVFETQAVEVKHGRNVCLDYLKGIER
jgi:recombination protein U